MAVGLCFVMRLVTFGGGELALPHLDLGRNNSTVSIVPVPDVQLPPSPSPPPLPKLP
jgi:hypothetical protein